MAVLKTDPIEKRRQALLRRDKTLRESKYTLSGRERQDWGPTPITLPKLKFMEGDGPESD